MALTYRSPIEEVLTLLEPNAQSLISNVATSSFQESEKDNFAWFCYHVPANAKEHLSKAGIYLSPYSGYPHSHPVCKTLENYLLYKVLPPLVNNTFYFVGIKEFKLNFLKKRIKQMSMIQAINRYVSSADKLRYGNEFVVRFGAASTELKRHHGYSSDPALRDLLPNIKRDSNLFFHDEMHYWEKNQLINFLEHCRPNTCLCTIVYPTEIFVGARRSLNPWAYEFEVKRDKLLFYPDGVRSEGYEQPVNCGYLLRTRKILLRDGTVYSVDIVCSKFSHHLVAITKGDLITPTYRSFGPFEAIKSVGLQGISRGRPKFYPVPCHMISRLYRYLRSLKKPDKQSAMAKFSQMCPEPSGDMIRFIEELSDLIINTGTLRVMIDAELCKNFFGNLGLALPASLASKIRSTRAVSLESFIASLEPLVVDCELQTVSWAVPLLPLLFSESPDDPPEDTIEIMEQRWEGGSNLLRDRAPAPYRGDIWGDAPRQMSYWSVGHHKIRFLRGLMDLYVDSMCTEGLPISITFEAYTIQLMSCCSILGLALIKSITPTESAEVSLIVGNTRLLDVLFVAGDLRWFRATQHSRYHVKFLDETADWARYKSEFECATYEKPRGVGHIGYLQTATYRFCGVGTRWSFDPNYNDEEDLGMNIYDHNATHNSEHQSSNVCWSAPQELATGDLLDCTCGAQFSMRTLAFPTEHGFNLEGKKSDGRVAWYSKSQLAYVHNAAHHESQGWPTWLSKWMELHEIDAEYYNSMLAEEHPAGGTVEYDVSDGELFTPGSRVAIAEVGGEAQLSIKCASGTCSQLLGLGDFVEMPESCRSTHYFRIHCGKTDGVTFIFRQINEQTPALRFDVGREKVPAPSVGGDAPRADSNDVHYTREGVVVHASGKCPDSKKFHRVPNAGGGDCFWLAISHFTGVSVHDMKQGLQQLDWESEAFELELAHQLGPKAWAEEEAIIATSKQYRYRIVILSADKEQTVIYSPKSEAVQSMVLYHAGSHFEAALPRNDCVLIAVASVLRRRLEEVLSILGAQLGSEFLQDVLKGEGIDRDQLAVVFKLFDICAHIHADSEAFVINPDGRLHGTFNLSKDHIEHCKSKPLGITKYTSVHDASCEIKQETLSMLKAMCTVLPYCPCKLRAKVLADSLNAGSTGVLCDELFNKVGNLLEANEGRLRENSREVGCLLGTFGAGKSMVFRKVLSNNIGKSILYISPRKHLADSFNELIKAIKLKEGATGVQGFRTFTFERAILKSTQFRPDATIIVDEIQLFPPGYLDLFSLLVPEGVHIFLVGDPCQSDYDSEKDRNLFQAMKSDINLLLDDVDYDFNCRSRRFKNKVFEGRLPCTMEPIEGESAKFTIIEGVENCKAIYPNAEVCLVSSFDEKKIVQTYFPSSCDCFTFGESTGMTYKSGVILITDTSQYTSERRWLTALSRFSHSISFVNATGGNIHLVTRLYQNRVLGRFLLRTAKVEDLKSLLPGRPHFKEGFEGARIGADEGKREFKLDGDPWLKTMLDLLQREDQEEVEEAVVELGEEWFRTHLPQCELEGVRARWVEKILAKEVREKRMGILVSEQFTDEHSKQLGKQITNAAERFETIYPRHRAADTVTFIMAVRKRLRFSDPIRESAKLRAAEMYGPFLLKEFLKNVPLKPMHDTRMMAEAKFDFEEKKTQKSAATIENHSNRSCRDWLADMGMVFSKSQLCTKFDNRFRDAKAAQTIVCFQHSVLCRFAPYMRYIEKKLNEVLPARFYIHSGKGLEELNKWVIESKFEGVCTESDYEAFDASQDQYIVAFELALMRYLGLPNDLIEDYKYIKTHLGSKLGNFAIMRFSGEASTFLFNTMANMLFTFLRYKLKGDERICFAGDDMCANRALFIKDTHEGFLKKLKLKAKVDRTNRPSFCGWSLCSDGIYKKPQLVFERLCIAKETANLANCIDNYAIEVSYAYKLGERIKERMSEEELEAFYNCVRVIIKHKHLLKSEIRSVYEEV
uniref:RNA-dependent RNA polymerase n=1 Tax=Potato virus S TaxID=12169 RepID=A0A346TJJ3_9VIRU|nr:RNA-dependent RNA polymerase [Potato virus S]